MFVKTRILLIGLAVTFMPVNTVFAEIGLSNSSVLWSMHRKLSHYYEAMLKHCEVLVNYEEHVPEFENNLRPDEALIYCYKLHGIEKDKATDLEYGREFAPPPDEDKATYEPGTDASWLNQELTPHQELTLPPAPPDQRDEEDLSEPFEDNASELSH